MVTTVAYQRLENNAILTNGDVVALNVTISRFDVTVFAIRKRTGWKYDVISWDSRLGPLRTKQQAINIANYWLRHWQPRFDVFLLERQQNSLNTRSYKKQLNRIQSVEEA